MEGARQLTNPFLIAFLAVVVSLVAACSRHRGVEAGDHRP
jgi:hypothetical protein